jgi:hypothetical protein
MLWKRKGISVTDSGSHQEIFGGGGGSLPPAQLSEATLDTLDTASALHAATVGLNPTPGNQRSR